MKIHFLGTCSGTEPMPERKHTAFAIETGDRLYWFDAGEGCSYTAHLKGLDLLSVCKVVISHTHMDHMGGLANLLWNIRKLTTVGEKRKTLFENIELYIPNLVPWEGVRMVLENSEGGFVSKFNVVPKLVEDGLLFDDGVMRVTAFHNHHLKHSEGEPWRSFTYRIECEGKVVVYSGDIKTYTDLDGAIGDGCDAAIVETGHFGIDDVHAYMSGKQVGHVFFNHNGREVLAGRRAACEKLERCFGNAATLCEDGMTAVLSEQGVCPEKESMQTALENMMLSLGFEKVSVSGKIHYRMGDQFVRLGCHSGYVSFELAHGYEDAKRNLYEDVDLYEYDYCKEKGMDVLEEIKADAIKYVVERYQEQ